MRSSRILCVDSSGRRLRELKAALERAGFEVWTALGAIDAVCLASERREVSQGHRAIHD